MKNKELYHKTVGILANAYFKDQLIAGNCAACAVGNLIAANNGFKIVSFPNGDICWETKDGNFNRPHWNEVFFTPARRLFGFRIGSESQELKLGKYHSHIRTEIESSGYGIVDLAKIENAFEKGYKGIDKMFNALMSVVDCLDEIHENTDKQITVSSKKGFKRETSCSVV